MLSRIHDGSSPGARRTARALVVSALASSVAVAAAPPQRLAGGVALELGAHRLEVRVCREDVIRVLYAPPGGFFQRDSLATVEGGCVPTDFELQFGDDALALRTDRLTARVALPGGEVSFFDRQGRPLLAERMGGKSLEPAEVMGESTFHVRARWEPAPGEAFYGLGAHQNGWMDYAGRDVDLYQSNTVDVVPFLVSSRGYGVLWDNTSHSRFGDLRPPVPVPPADLLDAEGRPGALTGTYLQGDCASGRVVAVRRDAAVAFGAPLDRPAISAVHNAPQAVNADLHPALEPGESCVVWEGEIESAAAGPYDLVTFSNNGLRLWWDGELEIDTYRQGWLPWWDSIRRDLGARERHRLKVEWHREETEGTLRLEWKVPPRDESTSLWSEVGDGIDYYFVYGPDLDDVVAGYRELTGRAPLMPRWALGLWQSRERYRTGQEVLDVLGEFRRREIPLDVMVQDWQYWKPDQWGSHEFDPERFPDPAQWLRRIHDEHARLVISVWPKFYTTTANFRAMQEAGFLYPETLKRPTTDWLGHVHTFYDAFNARARRLFWRQIDDALFQEGVDGWWMDASEPELVGEGTAAALKAAMHPTALGSGARMANAYVLVNNEAIYEGQRAASPDQRVVILTRSAFLGSQRYAAATWSGDVSADWDSLRRQIPAGLNMALSGIPWWTTDIGGFTVRQKWAREDPAPGDVEAWRELVTRWFQFGAFCPLLRVHGQFPYREMWNLGADTGDRAFTTQLAFDRLRYRLLPYTYSLAAAVTHRHASIMRPLVMDFRDDPEVLGIGDQFLFGPALLVNPVTRPGATSRAVYLPRDADWYDFWTGALEPGGRHIEAPAPYESLPLYVRAGSILPIGPELQFTGEKPADPLTLWVYGGADAAFELYEDDGASYAYERGAFATTPLRWDEAAGTLTLGARTGSFPGQLASRRVRVVFVSPGHAVGHSATPEVDREITYEGRALVVLRPAGGVSLQQERQARDGG
jgi:alpha-D-xyloside xylohydrolase